MTHAATKSSPIFLSYNDPHRDVVIEGSNEDRYVMKVEQAIRACRIFDQREVLKFDRQFRKLDERLERWVKDHDDKIEKALLTIRDRGLLFLVCQRTPEFDEELENSLTELDVDIATAEDLDLIQLSVLAIPDCSEEAVSCFGRLESSPRHGD